MGIFEEKTRKHLTVCAHFHISLGRLIEFDLQDELR